MGFLLLTRHSLSKLNSALVAFVGSEVKRKMNFSFAFHSLNRIFNLWFKILPLGNEKKNKFSFCISLAYPYLCILI